MILEQSPCIQGVPSLEGAKPCMRTEGLRVMDRPHWDWYVWLCDHEVLAHGLLLRECILCGKP